MKTKKLFLSLTVLSLILINCTQMPAPAPAQRMITTPHNLRGFHRHVETLLSQPRFQPSHFGIHIIEPETRSIIYSRNAHDLFMPASNMKLITTAAALSILGQDYQYKTKLYTDGKIEDGVLNGDLWIKGSGDPTISGRYYDGDINHVFKMWADTLKKMGINKIDGAIIGDDDIFDEQGLGYGWSHDDLSYYYAAKTGGLSYNDNCIDLYFAPGDTIGAQAKLWQKPICEYLKIENNLTTVHPDSQESIDFHRYVNTNKLKVFGTIPLDSDTTVDWVTVDNPSDFFLTGFKKCLKNAGIEFKEVYELDEIEHDKIEYDKMKLLFNHHSVKMDTIVYELNKVSQNFFAETLQKTLGVEEKNKGTNRAGIEVEENWFENIGIDPSSIFIRDGSGLSRHNLVTPFQIATILQTMKHSHLSEIYKKSLPVGGVDGTLRNRFDGSNAVGHVHAKTGYVGHVRALSGYVTAKNGREYIFSILVNHYPTPTSCINDLQDKIVTLLYNLEY
jgi:D-alanyl-D-alanine carboxypeptidase/D-alanyl-D-alanine-endopeptidase (penicillin-binding protein 4)